MFKFFPLYVYSICTHLNKKNDFLVLQCEKVKLFQGLTKYNAMKMNGGVEV